MTEDELTQYRLKLRVEIRSLALEQIVGAVGALPGGRLALLDWANRLRKLTQAQTIPSLDAAMSDLAASEYQEAVKEMLAGLGL